MRIRKSPRLLAESKKSDVSSLLKQEGDGMEEEKRKKVVEETIPINESHIHDAAKPVGNVVKVFGEGKKVRKYFASFEYKGNQYNLEDSVMLWSGIENKKPFVAIIKEIIQERNGNMMLNVQWFYRPEDTEKGGKRGHWESSETRELYYSFHQDETHVASIIHKCVVHFIPLGKEIPYLKQHPGFVVQKVYDPEQKKLFKFTDNGYFKNKKEQIDSLIQKTMSRVGELPDVKANYDSKKKKKLMY